MYCRLTSHHYSVPTPRVSLLSRRVPIALISILTLCLLPFLVHGLVQTRSAKTQPADIKPASLALLSETVSVHAAGLGNPAINLSDGRDVLTSYVGPEELRLALEQNLAAPLSLASADFDEDGVPDLVGGYSYNGQGIVSMLRGNVDSIYPNAPAAKQRQAEGAFTNSPFLSPARAFAAPVPADFIGAGDFDGDSHWDVVIGSRTGRSLFLFSGDGKGGFAAAQEIVLPGLISAMTTGEINRADGLTDVVVGVDCGFGAEALIFEGPNGALKAQPEVLPMPGTVSALALGQLDSGYEMDLAVGAGTQLVVVHGRDRRISLDGKRQQTVLPASVDARAIGSPIKSLALGDFTALHEPALAMLVDDGTVFVLHPEISREEGLDRVPPIELWSREQVESGQWGRATQLARVKISAFPGDDLLVVDAEAKQLHIVSGDKLSARPVDADELSATMQLTGAVNSITPADMPVAALPMQLDGDALGDIVLLRAGSVSSSVMLTKRSSEGIAGQMEDGGEYPVLGGGLTIARSQLQGSNNGTTSPDKSVHLPGGLTPQSGNCPSTAISYGQTLNGALTTTDCRFTSGAFFDSYSFNGNAGEQIAVALNSTTFDNFVYLVGPDGTALAIDDDGNGGTNARIPAFTGFFQLPFNGTYTILVTSVASSVTGGYLISLGVSPATCVPTPMNFGQAYSGTLGATDCSLPNGAYGDLYIFNGLAGQQIAVGLTSLSFDSLIYLYAPNGSLLALGDDANFYDARIPEGGGFLTLPASGTYTIIVSSFSARVTGNYEVAVTNNANGCPVTPITFGQTLNSSLSSSDCGFNGPFYADSYTFFGVAGYPISIRMSSSAVNSYLYLLAPTGDRIAVDDNGGGTTDARIPAGNGFAVLPQTGLYTIIATSFSSFETGNYTINLSFAIGSTVVTNTNNDGPGSLRQAMLAANADPGANTISFSIPGSGVKTITPLSVLPPLTGPVTIDGTTQPGYVGQPLIEINGLQAGPQTVGLKLLGGNSRVRGLVINRFSIAAIALTAGGNNIVDGNYIGTDNTGLNPQPAPPNGAIESQGIILDGSSNNVIGGTTVAARNVISGNRDVGVLIERSGRSVPQGNQVQGNYIGLGANGITAFGNGSNGVVFLTGTNNVIGGAVAGARNIISGNPEAGVGLGGFSDTTGNLVQGNYIGTNVVGNAPLGVQGSGVIVGGILQRSSEILIATHNTVGGTSIAARNVISGNRGAGIELINTGTVDNVVLGNFVGLNAAGAGVIGNAGSGVLVTFANNNIVGGDVVGAGNIIVGNGDYGVGVGLPRINPLTGQPIIGGKGIDILGNYIGTDAGGAAHLGNGKDGVLIAADAVDNNVARNIIAFNSGTGIFIPKTTPGSPSNNPGVRNSLDGNLIYQNSALGIDLQDPGITANDPLDADVGANLQQNFPVLESVSGAASRAPINPSDLGPDATVTVNGKLNSTPNTAFTVHWYFSADVQCVTNQQTSRPLVTGKVPGVTTNANGDAQFNFPLDLPVGINNGIVNCTATDPQGNTSEFSACLLVNGAAPPPPTPTPLASPVVQWESSSYSAAENVGSRTLTVTRTGNSSNGATVNYTTSDTAGLNSCSQVNTGKASSRCDYETTMGTLSFAAGETTKTISIPIVDDAYAEGNESFTVTLSNAVGASLGSASVATVTITDNETTTGQNPITQAGFFARLHYVDFLNREPDASGLTFWTNEITQCGTDQACIELKRINVSAAFYVSIEFQDTGYLVERIYRVAYGSGTGTSTLGGASHQLSVPVIRFNEFLPDTQEIGQGVVVGQSGWEAKLESNKQAFMNEFVQRPRFTTAYPGTMTAAQFVDALNSNAGNALSVTERNQLVSDLATNAKTRAQVLRAVAEDPDLKAAEFNRAFVLMQFYGYLRRNPNDPQDTDYTGYDFWLGKLNQFGGSYINAEMVKAFIASTEYKVRFGP